MQTATFLNWGVSIHSSTGNDMVDLSLHSADMIGPQYFSQRPPYGMQLYLTSRKFIELVHHSTLRYKVKTRSDCTGARA